MVARILGVRLNFKRPREITGQRSEGADQAVADAVKAANALMLGRHNLASSVLSTITSPKPNYTRTVCPDDPKPSAQAMAAMNPSKSARRTTLLRSSHRRSGHLLPVHIRARRQRNPRPARMRIRYGLNGVPTHGTTTHQLHCTIHKLRCGDKSFKQTASSGGPLPSLRGFVYCVRETRSQKSG